jgi:hypothetical protein
MQTCTATRAAANRQIPCRRRGLGIMLEVEVAIASVLYDDERDHSSGACL